MTPTPLPQLFHQQFARPHTALIRAPGRVNLIGEHTDYNDGFVLPCAIDFATHVAIAPNGSRSVRVYAADYGERDEFSLDTPIAPSDKQWANYILGVGRTRFQAARRRGHRRQRQRATRRRIKLVCRAGSCHRQSRATRFQAAFERDRNRPNRAIRRKPLCWLQLRHHGPAHQRARRSGARRAD